MEESDTGIRTTRRIRLLWLIDSLTMGGAERLVRDFGRHLDMDLFDLRVACLKVIEGNPIASELEAIGVPVSIIGARNLRDVNAFMRLVRMVRRCRIDLIHTHLTYADIWGGLAGMLTRRPVVATIHVPSYSNPLNPGRRDHFIDAIAIFIRKTFGNTVISVSEALRTQYILRGHPSEHITTIHNGIDLSSFELATNFSKVAKRAEFRIPPNAPVVVSLGVLRKGKGHYTLIEAARLVLDKIPEVRFLIVGGGPLEKELREYVESHELSDRIILLGMRKDPAEMLALGDLFVHPSEFDSFPTAVLEAMAMSLPIIAFNTGGIPEIVVHQKTGLLVPLSNANELSNAMQSLLENPEQAVQMGHAGRSRVETEFTSEKWVSRLQDLYFGILNRQGFEFPTKRKIVVVEFLGKGGMIHYAYQLCSAMSEFGVNVKLITAKDYELNNMKHNFTVDEIFELWNPRPIGAVEWSNTIRAKWSRFLQRIRRGRMYYRAWLQLILYLRRERPDVVQLGEIRFVTDLIPIIILKLGGFRLSDICHNIAPFDTTTNPNSLVKTSIIYRFFYRLLYKCFFTIFVHGEFNKSEFLGIYGGNPGRIHVIPHGSGGLFHETFTNGTDVDTLRRKLNISKNARVILFFGTLTKYKGLEYLLEAFAIVRSKLPDPRLLVAGFPNPDADIDALFKKADQLGIRESVVFHLQYIPNEEVASFFNLADVVVFPYVAIYQSGALHLALSLCKPVVATKVGAIPEVVNNEETGLLVRPKDSESLAEALLALLNDPERARQMGQRAKDLSEKAFAWRKVAERIQNVYFDNPNFLNEIP